MLRSQLEEAEETTEEYKQEIEDLQAQLLEKDEEISALLVAEKARKKILDKQIGKVASYVGR